MWKSPAWVPLLSSGKTLNEVSSQTPAFTSLTNLAFAAKNQLDLAVDPPPDLIFTVDISRSSMSKQSLFAKFGVPELWRYDGTSVDIFRLIDGTDRRSPRSGELPSLTEEILTSFVTDYLTLTRVQWIKRFGDWIRQQKQEE
jgi:hypothetical protein